MDGAAGVFITFEGGEGAGKSTQVHRLAAKLRAAGREVVTTREPGGSPTAEVLRAFILGGRAKRLGTIGEAYLFAAARLDHVEETIRPALSRGATVICDRFTDSTRVYQGAVGGLDPAVIEHLEQAAVDGLRPDLTVILDVPVPIALRRLGLRAGQGGPDRFEREALSVHEARRQAFLAIAAAEPDRCLVVDGAGDVDTVEQAVTRAIENRLDLDLSAIAEA